METSSDDSKILIEKDYRKQSFLRKKVSLTITICVLLFIVFILSLFIVSTISLYWTEDADCYVNTNKQTIKSKPVYNSRPKRSLTSKKVNLTCVDAQCCSTNLNSNIPWNQSRLPTNIYPIEYQLKLELYNLTEDNNRYDGAINIVIEIQSATNDIILHGDLFYSNISVTQRSNPENISLTIDCVIQDSNTQTLTIHLIEQLQVGNVYDVRISFSQVLNIHGTGIFENQFNKDQYGTQ